jgi:hypothetical protein
VQLLAGGRCRVLLREGRQELREVARRDAARRVELASLANRTPARVSGGILLPYARRSEASRMEA